MDDFGYNANINAAILRSCEQGRTRIASIMANVPGFDEACEIVKRYNLYEKVGN